MHNDDPNDPRRNITTSQRLKARTFTKTAKALCASRPIALIESRCQEHYMAVTRAYCIIFLSPLRLNGTFASRYLAKTFDVTLRLDTPTATNPGLWRLGNPRDSLQERNTGSTILPSRRLRHRCESVITREALQPGGQPW